LAQLCSLSPTAKGKDTPEHVPLPGNKTRDGKPGPVISADSFRAMLKYVYFGDTNFSSLIACELIPFSHDYGLEKLQDICEQKIQGPLENTTALPILSTTYLIQMEASMRVVQVVFFY
jgi:hypothetical protein